MSPGSMACVVVNLCVCVCVSARATHSHACTWGMGQRAARLWGLVSDPPDSPSFCLLGGSDWSCCSHAVEHTLAWAVSGLSHLLSLCWEQRSLVWGSPTCMSPGLWSLISVLVETSAWPVLWALLPPAAPDTETLRTTDITASVLPLEATECLALCCDCCPMGTFGLRFWLSLVVGERESAVLSTLETCPQGNFYNCWLPGKMRRKDELRTFAHVSHMLVLVFFNFQKFNVGVLCQILKLGCFFPFKTCKLKIESSGIYFIVD